MDGSAPLMRMEPFSAFTAAQALSALRASVSVLTVRSREAPESRSAATPPLLPVSTSWTARWLGLPPRYSLPLEAMESVLAVVLFIRERSAVASRPEASRVLLPMEMSL